MIDPIKIMLLLDNSLIRKEYFILLMFLLFAVILTVLIIGASYFLAKQNPESEKLSAYECGFEPYEDTRHTFDIRATQSISFHFCEIRSQLYYIDILP